MCIGPSLSTTVDTFQRRTCGYIPRPAEVPDGDAATGPASPADDGGIDPTDGERAGDGGAATADTAAVPDGPVVAQVMRAGYVWRGTVVRPAMVLVRG